jgi:hypothetical protein
MEYRQIVAVTGLPGLFQLMSTKSDGAIVKSLADKSLKFVSARIHHLTPLESIEIYTTGDNVRLHEVFEIIKQDDAAAIKTNSTKDNNAAKALFKQILPDFDEDRVYTSDIKKVFKWYAILKENDLLHFEYLKDQPEGSLPDVQAEDAALPAEEKTDKVGPEEKKSTPKAKKTTVKKAESEPVDDVADKKAPPKKKVVSKSDEEKPKKVAARKKGEA